MKTFRATSGPFRTRPYYEDREIESICADELARVGLLPSAPAPVRIERFIEKRFNVTPTYADMGEGVLGLTKFDSNGVAEVLISQRLEEAGTKVAERRIWSTMAHEAGHCLLHAHLYSLGDAQSDLFRSGRDAPEPVLCRGDLEAAKNYNGEWWEYQANRTIGAFLMPRRLVEIALRPFMIDIGKLGFWFFDRTRTEEAARSLAETFDVNPAVARVRIAQMWPVATAQAAL